MRALCLSDELNTMQPSGHHSECEKQERKQREGNTRVKKWDDVLFLYLHIKMHPDFFLPPTPPQSDASDPPSPSSPQHIIINVSPTRNFNLASSQVGGKIGNCRVCTVWKKKKANKKEAQSHWTFGFQINLTVWITLQGSLIVEIYGLRSFSHPSCQAPKESIFYSHS